MLHINDYTENRLFASFAIYVFQTFLRTQILKTCEQGTENFTKNILLKLLKALLFEILNKNWIVDIEHKMATCTNRFFNNMSVDLTPHSPSKK